MRALLIAALLLVCAPLVHAQTGSSLRAVVAEHLAAIQARDLDALMGTVTNGDSITVIFPNGEAIHTRQEFVDLHTEWFAEEGWSVVYEPRQYIEGTNLATVLVHYTITDGTPASGRQTLLALTFRREDESRQWRLVFDQNTRIQTP